MTSIDDVLDAHRPVTRSVRVVVDGQLLGDLDRLEEQLAEARRQDDRLNRPPQAPAIAEQIRQLRDRANTEAVEFTFEAIGRKAWSDLQAQHPPTDEQIAEGRDDGIRPDFNPETFPAAAIAASCVEPSGMTVEKAQRLLDGWTVSQTRKLWSACLSANIGGADIPFSEGAYDVLRRSGGSSTTAPLEVSPDPSS